MANPKVKKGGGAEDNVSALLSFITSWTIRVYTKKVGFTE